MMIPFLRSVVFVKPISALDTGSATMLLYLGKESSSLLPFLLCSLPLSQFLCLSLSFSHKGSNQRKDFRVFWESVLLMEAGWVGAAHAGSGKREENIPGLTSHLPFMLLWVAGWEKLLPWLQATRKQKRRLWCCHNCGRGAGLGKSWEAISIPPVFSWGLFPCGIQWSRHFPWLKLPSPQLVT